MFLWYAGISLKNPLIWIVIIKETLLYTLLFSPF